MSITAISNPAIPSVGSLSAAPASQPQQMAVEADRVQDGTTAAPDKVVKAALPKGVGEKVDIGA
jgi:hypothetical protein